MFHVRPCPHICGWVVFFFNKPSFSCAVWPVCPHATRFVGHYNRSFRKTPYRVKIRLMQETGVSLLSDNVCLCDSISKSFVLCHCCCWAISTFLQVSDRPGYSAASCFGMCLTSPESLHVWLDVDEIILKHHSCWWDLFLTTSQKPTLWKNTNVHVHIQGLFWRVHFEALPADGTKRHRLHLLLF